MLSNTMIRLIITMQSTKISNDNKNNDDPQLTQTIKQHKKKVNAKKSKK